MAGGILRISPGKVFGSLVSLLEWLFSLGQQCWVNY
jgi:hypothetical protein